MDPAVLLGMIVGIAISDPILIVLGILLGYNARRWWIWLLGSAAAAIVASGVAAAIDPLPYDHWGQITIARMFAVLVWAGLARGVRSAKRKFAKDQSSSGSD